MDSMPSNSASNIATADALTLLLHNHHALAAAIGQKRTLANDRYRPKADV